MWIPYTDAVVVVASNPISIGAGHSRWDEAPLLSVPDVTFTEGQRLAPLLALLREQGEGQESCDELNFAELRDMLLARSPLDCAWIKKVNGAEAEFWRRSQGQRIDYSDRILGFECGGQQWVNEVALHAGTACHPTGADMNFLQDLLRHIEGASIPAPAPIEQRWTASSSSSMSPAYGACGDELYSWVGIIMYLPLEDSQQRDAVTSAFFSYRDECKKALWARYGCAEHWAKVCAACSIDIMYFGACLCSLSL
jgi:L-galactono-1,4-lactone dehydrogenase